MISRKRWIRVFAISLLSAVTFCTGVVAQHAKEKVLHSFDTRKGDGIGPISGLIFDSSGNLYGATSDTQYGGFGTVFELTPNADGTWSEAILYSFTDGGGFYPSSPLLFDAAGNLYGATRGGGNYRHRVGGLGTVYELSFVAGVGWTGGSIFSFDQSDGASPSGNLALDASGNLYGTTSSGGGGNLSFAGTVYEVSPIAGGGWAETVLKTFTAQGANRLGSTPRGGVVLDSAGNLYGTTSGGGESGDGLAFRLSPSEGGGWMETVLFSFSGSNGSNPSSALVFDSQGNLYGTTESGGSRGGGTVFELSPNVGGSWNETTLYNFDPQTEGAPDGALALDSMGRIYGSTVPGGANCCGQIFELTDSGGAWTETILFTFDGPDGSYPDGGMALDASGNIYGTTLLGGIKDSGTVFEIAPK